MKDANLANKRLDSARLTPPVYSCATCPAAQAQRWERDA